MIQNRAALSTTPRREAALDCIESGIDAANPARVIERKLVLDGDTLVIDGDRYALGNYDRILVIGGGKANDAVATGLERLLGDRIDSGAVVTLGGDRSSRIDRLPGDHPVPGEASIASTKRVLMLAEEADESTLVLAPITGGGSALMTAPADGIGLEELQTVTDALLKSGAEISEINTVRKHLSQIKGGGLARAAAPATVIGLVFSDVVGNDLAVIASGPTAPDHSTFENAIEVLGRYGVDAPASVKYRLEDGRSGGLPDTPGADDRVFDHVTNYILADGFTALDAAKSTAADLGYTPCILASGVRGEAREAAKTHVAIAEESLLSGHPVAPPAVLLSGGETTVTVRGTGTGGPNQEFALSAALESSAPITVASVDTDGADGSTDAAGGLVDESSIDDPDTARSALDDNDAYHYLEGRHGLLITGVTGTNVNDLRVIVVGSPSGS